ncbi:hypothetical protein NJL88_35445 [Streptomyces sp. DK15]|uniref:hypothetical protein n=1 Tax=Streptomyces sp. DK15 TaxID=2957499 RepID=UPI0029AF5D93|nr:hypothetical protein [Streptomyces sp. DK15]MDX2395260.1 hypothetical protein [Streptomyces sp. DK15]
MDAHADELKHHPEAQEIETIRGALGRVWNLMKEKAGSDWSRLTNDIRFQGFWKTISIRACEAISERATALADRLRPDLPSAEALLKLSDATLTYSAAASAEPAPAPAQQATADAPGPSTQRLVGRDAPSPYATREDAMRAAQDVAARFQEWIKSPMGEAVVASGHIRVAEFRDAWTQLPAHDGPPGPAVGAYEKVGERAQALLRVAVIPPVTPRATSGPSEVWPRRPSSTPPACRRPCRRERPGRSRRPRPPRRSRWPLPRLPVPPAHPSSQFCRQMARPHEGVMRG